MKIINKTTNVRIVGSHSPLPFNLSTSFISKKSLFSKICDSGILSEILSYFTYPYVQQVLSRVSKSFLKSYSFLPTYHAEISYCDFNQEFVSRCLEFPCNGWERFLSPGFVYQPDSPLFERVSVKFALNTDIRKVDPNKVVDINLIDASFREKVFYHLDVSVTISDENLDDIVVGGKKDFNIGDLVQLRLIQRQNHEDDQLTQRQNHEIEEEDDEILKQLAIPKQICQYPAKVQELNDSKIDFKLLSTVLVNASSLGYTSVVSEYELEIQWDKYQSNPYPEGVVWCDHAVGKELKDSLLQHIEKLKENGVEDYHPNSKNVVRDHVHPALYSFIKGISPFNPSEDLKTIEINNEKLKFDRWNRKYENSKYQWLPTYFDINHDGTVQIRGYINNLTPRKNFKPLYKNLETLFGLFVPKLEPVISYGRNVRFLTDDVLEVGIYDWSDDRTAREKLNLERVSLKGSSIQAITKIVDYELDPGQSYEGVWHVEGMSHEHIVATCLYILDRDDSIEGGDILYKRAFTASEAKLFSERSSQVRSNQIDEIMSNGLTPLGKVGTPRERMIVFPNSHVHKVSKMTNTGTEKAFRRIVVFFIVDPERRIVSTQEVPDQTATLSRDEALKHRLELMKERKFHKQDWNVRDIELCEH